MVPTVLIIDEFGQFSNENITGLLSLARSAQLGIILATQDTASLTNDSTYYIAKSDLASLSK